MSTNSEKKYYYDRNHYILDNPEINPTFEELLLMSIPKFEEWVLKMRKEVVDIWDKYGVPPLGGLTSPEMSEELKKMSGTPGTSISMWKQKSGGTKPYIDELDGNANIAINDGFLGAFVNQFFPTMMSAKINYSNKVEDDGKEFNGYAVYDLFANDRFIGRMQKGCRRHFKRDSFYSYSASIPKNSDVGLIPAQTGTQWVNLFKNNPTNFREYGFWLSRVETPEEGEKGTGYTQIDLSKFLWLSKSEIIELYNKGIIGKENLTNLIFINEETITEFDLSGLNVFEELYNVALRDQLKDNEQYHIRFFKKSLRIFPLGFKAFRIGYAQVCVNFPPMVAKYLYEKYTEHCKKQDVINIYDPSSGWGGRITGAMTVMDDRHIHYIGTDPNTNNLIPELGISRYEYLAEFINKSLKRYGYEPHTHHVFQLGSEVIGDDPEFQQYKGKLDLVFTSPPYFSRERYSEDESQSCNKFSGYQEWVQGFLRPTLVNAYNSLKRNRYLLWNIADIKTGDTYIPLEKDSCDILKTLGAEFICIEKLALASMPGANRISSETNTPMCKNFMKVKGRYMKYEPIFVFRKP